MDSERVDVAGLFLELLNLLNTYFSKRQRFGSSRPREQDTHINAQVCEISKYTAVIAEEVLRLAVILGLEIAEEDRGWNILWETGLQVDDFQEKISTQETDLAGLLTLGRSGTKN